MYKNTFYVYYREDDITHHGIKGQRWGVRRYQNPDGSLTPAGEKRYGKIRQETDTLLKQDLPTDRSSARKYNRQANRLISKAARKGDSETVRKLTERMAPYYNKQEIDESVEELVNPNKKLMTVGAIAGGSIGSFVGGYPGALTGSLLGSSAAALPNLISAANRDKKARAREGITYLKTNSELYNIKMNDLYKKRYKGKNKK